MKKGRIIRSLLALVMIFQITSCGAAMESADAMVMNKTAPAEAVRTTAATAYYDGGLADAEFGTAAGYSTYSYTADSASGSSVKADTAGVNDLSERKIIKNATVRYETKTYDEFFTGLTECIRKYGAYVESEESYGGSLYDYYSTRRAYLTVRVPLATYDAFMSEACSFTLGTVTYKSENSTDVTMAYVDTESRITSLETEYDALIAILEKASKLEDVISLQSRISEVTYELETYKAQLRKYDDLISYCTVSIDVTEVEKVTQNVSEMTFGEKIRTGLTDTFEDIASDASDFAVWFVTSLPYFLIWGVLLAAGIAILYLLIVRCRKRRILRTPEPPDDSGQQKQAELFDKEYENNKPDQTNL